MRRDLHANSLLFCTEKKDLRLTICIPTETLWPLVALLAFDSLPVTLVNAGVLRLSGQCARAGAVALPPLSTYTAGAPLDAEGQR